MLDFLYAVRKEERLKLLHVRPTHNALWIPIFLFFFPSFLLGQELSSKVHFAFWCCYSCIMRISINPYQTAVFLTRAPFHSNENPLVRFGQATIGFHYWYPSTFCIKMSQILNRCALLPSALAKLLACQYLDHLPLLRHFTKFPISILSFVSHLCTLEGSFARISRRLKREMWRVTFVLDWNSIICRSTSRGDLNLKFPLLILELPNL